MLQEEEEEETRIKDIENKLCETRINFYSHKKPYTTSHIS